MLSAGLRSYRSDLMTCFRSGSLGPSVARVTDSWPLPLLVTVIFVRPLSLSVMGSDVSPMPGAERDEETGRFTTAYPDDRAVEAITDAGGAASTQEVADAIGSQRETAYKKLVRLEEAGQVNSRKVGNARLWSVGDARGGKTKPEGETA